MFDMIENRPFSDPKYGTNGNEAADLIAEFAVCMRRGDTPDSPAAQSAAYRWCACRTCGFDGMCKADYPTDTPSYDSDTAGYIARAVEYYKNGMNSTQNQRFD